VSHGKDVLTVLKANQRGLLQDAQALLEEAEPVVYETDKSWLEIREVGNFTEVWPELDPSASGAAPASGRRRQPCLNWCSPRRPGGGVSFLAPGAPKSAGQGSEGAPNTDACGLKKASRTPEMAPTGTRRVFGRPCSGGEGMRLRNRYERSAA